ncbi:MAG: transposase [Burkholderiales bacterium]
MPRFKPIDRGMKLLPIDLSVQLLPGTFEHALSHLIDEELDLSPLDRRFKNDESGAPAYAPSVLLKVVLYAYSRGMIRSRDIATACEENVVFMALSGDNLPHFTTIAAFVRDLKDEIANLFTQVLFLCDAQGLIGREMFAIDGVKLPSNASKAKSGTRAEFEHQAGKLALDLIGGSKPR